MWFTPPKLPPFNLKLRSFQGGSSFPSEFYGVTEDNRPIYVRYRGGWIKLDQGEIDASQNDPMQELLSAKVGPPLDGAILAEQVCEILGLDVPDMRPVSYDVLMEGRRYEPIRDLSRSTTFWDAFIHTTKAGMPGIFESLPALGEPYVIFEHGKDCQYQQIALLSEAESAIAYFGLDPVPGALNAMSGPYNPEHRQALFSALLKVSFFFLRNKASSIHLGPDHGFERMYAPWIHLSLECPTESSRQRDVATEVVEAIRSQVGTQVDLIDPETRTVVRREEVWYSRDLRDWCLEASNRVIGFRSELVGGGKFDTWAMRPAVS